MMTDQSPIVDTAAPKALRLTLARGGVITTVALLPAAIGLFHLFVYRLVPFSGAYQVAQPSGSEDTQAAPVSSPSVRPEPPGVARARHAIATTLPLVFGSCIVACLVLGLLGVSHALAFAFLQGFISTAAFMISQGQGAFLGPIMFTAMFWILIVVGTMIRGAVAGGA